MFLKGKRSAYVIFISLTIIIVSVPCFYYIETRFSYYFLEEYLKDHTIPEDISFSSGNTSGIRLNPSSDPTFYLACLPTEVSSFGSLRLSFSHFKILELDGHRFHSGEDIFDYAKASEETPISMRLFAPRGELLYEGYVQFIFSDSLPSVYLNVTENSIEAVNLSDYEDQNPIHVSSILKIINPDGSLNSLMDITIHRHGNTSFDNYDPKPYNLNLPAAKGLLGMSPCSKWVLKANAQYPTVLMKNKAALEVAKRIGCLGIPESRFVNLYINGTYNGLYLLCQRVQSYDLMNRDGMKYLVELDVKYHMREHYFELDGNGMAIHLPKDISEEEAKMIEQLFTMAVASVKTGKEYEQYIDLESFIKMYLLQDFFVQTDIDGDSLYFYIGNNNKIYAGPAWDFDCSCGHFTSGPYHERMSLQARYFNDFGKLFFKELEKSDDFRRLCAEFYETHMSDVVIDYVSTTYKSELSEIRTSANMSMKLNEMQETGNRVDDDPVALGEWLNARAAFLRDYYKNETEYNKVKFIFAWGSITSAVKTGEPIGFLPDDRHPGNNDDIWGEIDGFAKESGQIVDDKTIICDDTSLYALYDEESMTVINGIEPL